MRQQVHAHAHRPDLRRGLEYAVRKVARRELERQRQPLKELEKIDADRDVRWPERIDSLEKRWDWRNMLAGRTWIIFNKPTLGNTRAVVRYLSRYTSRIAISNHRVKEADAQQRTVSFEWKDYKDGGRIKTMTLPGAAFVRRFTRHLVPKGFRRIRNYGLLAGRPERFREIPAAPRGAIAERQSGPCRPECPQCHRNEWRYLCFYRVTIDLTGSPTTLQRFSLSTPPGGP
jgi:hypothetical protein